MSGVELIEPDHNKIILTDGSKMSYDFLILATGSRIAPEEVSDLIGPGWRKNIFDFYTPEGAVALRNFFRYWDGGRMVLNIAEMPIKCPVAPLEFDFLADWWFTENNMREKVEITLVTPLEGAFTRPIASKYLGDILQKKNINLVTDYGIESIDSEKNIISSYEEEKIEYDMLVSVPTNLGSSVIEKSGIGDDNAFVPTEKHTLLSKIKDNVLF